MLTVLVSDFVNKTIKTKQNQTKNNVCKTRKVYAIFLCENRVNFARFSCPYIQLSCDGTGTGRGVHVLSLEWNCVLRNAIQTEQGNGAPHTAPSTRPLPLHEGLVYRQTDRQTWLQQSLPAALANLAPSHVSHFVVGSVECVRVSV